ncbi:SSI family serine proteinase inhibitor [Streptomyces sp. NPDC002845]
MLQTLSSRPASERRSDSEQRSAPDHRPVSHRRPVAPPRPAFRRLLLGAAASLTVAAGLAPVAYAEGGGPWRSSERVLPTPVSEDRLIVTVEGVGRGGDGTYELECHPDGGSHPVARDACGRLDRSTRWGKDPFAPVAPGTMCTMQYGGPATAHVTGTWAGRPVDARFRRNDGCEIARWDALVPVLPGARA